MVFIFANVVQLNRSYGFSYAFQFARNHPNNAARPNQNLITPNSHSSSKLTRVNDEERDDEKKGPRSLDKRANKEEGTYLLSAGQVPGAPERLVGPFVGERRREDLARLDVQPDAVYHRPVYAASHGRVELAHAAQRQVDLHGLLVKGRCAGGKQKSRDASC